jgi:hypothetical protein
VTLVRRAVGRGTAKPRTLETLAHDVDVTWFDNWFGRLLVFALAGVAGVVAANLGVGPAVATCALAAAGLAIAVVVIERDRWRAQDIALWRLADRTRRWYADTGGDSPGSPAEAEVWLGSHQPGTVPQRYRALAALNTTDDVTIAREIAAMPQATPEDRAWRSWVIAARQVMASEFADDVSGIRETLPALPSDDQASMASWLAQSECVKRYLRGDPAWLAPLLEIWPSARRVPLGRRTVVRLWLSRFIVVLAFGLTAIGFVAFGLQVASEIPRDYAKTEVATRGDVGDIDDQRLWSALPRLAGSISGATRLDPNELDPDRIDELIFRGLPTVIWKSDAISLAPPPDAAGRHMWSIEVLVGDARLPAEAIVTFDDENGPAYLYAVDPEVTASLRAALDVGGMATP